MTVGILEKESNYTAALGNLIWFVLGGEVLGLFWLIIAGLFYLTIIGIPFGRACLEFAKLSAFPFGKEIIRDTELLGKENVARDSYDDRVLCRWYSFLHNDYWDTSRNRLCPNGEVPHIALWSEGRL